MASNGSDPDPAGPGAIPAAIPGSSPGAIPGSNPGPVPGRRPGRIPALNPAPGPTSSPGPNPLPGLSPSPGPHPPPTPAAAAPAGPARADDLVTTAAAALKIAVVGNLGVGKTTLVTSVSEIRPLTTEETMTRAGSGVDDVSRVASKTTTTVAMDFGRISLNERLVLYLFGTPGQERFWFLWDGLVDGALGAVVLADARRLAECFDVLDRLEKRGVPFIVAVNDFPGAPIHPVPRLRGALDLPESVPVMHCDARERTSSRDVLLTLARYLLQLSKQAEMVSPSYSRPESPDRPA